MPLLNGEGEVVGPGPLEGQRDVVRREVEQQVVRDLVGGRALGALHAQRVLVVCRGGPTSGIAAAGEACLH